MMTGGQPAGRHSGRGGVPRGQKTERAGCEVGYDLYAPGDTLKTGPTGERILQCPSPHFRGGLCRSHYRSGEPFTMPGEDIEAAAWIRMKSLYGPEWTAEWKVIGDEATG